MREHPTALRKRFVAGTCAVALGASLALMPLSSQPTPALASPASSKQAEAQEALNSLNAMKDRLSEAEGNYQMALGQQMEAQKKMDEAQGRIEEANEQIGGLQEQLSARAKSMYMNGATSFLDILLGSATFTAFTTNWDALNTMNQNDADMVTETKALRTEVEAKKAEFAEQEKVASDKADEMQAIVEESEALIAEQEQIYEELSAEAAALVRQEEEAEEDRQRQAASGNNGNRGPVSNAPADDGTIVGRAKSCLGLPYAWGAVGPNSFDCSGLVSYCLTGSYSRLGTTYTFLTYPQVSDPQPGDICVNANHCGIYVGGGEMIHAPQSGDVVKYGPVQSGMIYVRY